MPNVKPILVKNYKLVNGVPVLLDDFYAPCVVSAPSFPTTTNVGAGTGQRINGAAVVLANSKAEALTLSGSVGVLGITYPLRLRRLVGVWAACNSVLNTTMLSVIGDGEESE